MDNSGKTILLVEDEPIIALMEKRWLINVGFKVIHANSGEEAIEIAGSRENNIDLILMDIDLGSDTMDGTQAAREILYKNNIPLLFLSSHTEKEIVERTEEITSYGYVVKGSSNTVLLASMKMAFKLFAANQELSHNIQIKKETEERLRRINRELRAISSCNQMIIRASDEQRLLQDFCRIICGTAGYRMAWVGFAEKDEEKNIRPVAWDGYEENYLKEINITWADTVLGQGPTGKAIRTGEHHYIQDLESDSGFAPWLAKGRDRGYRSSIGLPLKDDTGNTFGALTIYSEMPNPFTPEEIRMLEELAGDLAFGITSLRIKALRIKAENDLRISELRFHTVTDQNRDAIAFMDRDMKKLYVNTAFAALTGVSQEDAVKMSGLELVHPEDKIKVKSLFVEILKNPGSRKSITYRILHADGSCRWIESTGTNLLDDISVGAVIVHSRDITELKEASKKSI